ncbi:alpha/beta hydrolase [Roseateles sp.]|uniref:alpha/beta hydrolase n=1 Tax=Roseateles sp. TaxID=1971397 RepID=UPI0037C62AA2
MNAWRWVGVLCLGLWGGLPGSAVAQADASPEPHVYRELADGRRLQLHVFKPTAGTSPAPAVLTVHGGGWSMGEASWTFSTAARMARLGYLGVALEYRLSNGADTPAEAQDDVCQALSWLRSHAERLNLDAQRIAAHGVSAGGQLVSAAALGACAKVDRGPDLLMLWSPALDLERDGWFGKLLQGRASRESLSPLSLIGRREVRAAPVAIVQGGADSLTPAAGARALCERARALGGLCELHEYAGLGHLLTRNLAQQESGFDPDPDKRRAGIAAHDGFLQRLWPRP